MRICIVGADFALLEARVLANAIKLGVDVTCIKEEDMGLYTTLDAVIVEERISLAQYLNVVTPVVLFKARAYGATRMSKALKALPSTPHWVTRNNLKRRF